MVIHTQEFKIYNTCLLFSVNKEIVSSCSFMYTGKLEFPADLQPKLYEAATKLRMTILTRLLDAQPKSNNSQTNESYPKLLAYQHPEGQVEYSSTMENSQVSVLVFTCF